MTDGALCPKCHKHPAQEPHFCPYDLDVNNDVPEHHTKCLCCRECEVECGDNI
jgi:hypothetical protein